MNPGKRRKSEPFWYCGNCRELIGTEGVSSPGDDHDGFQCNHCGSTVTVDHAEDVIIPPDDEGEHVSDTPQ